MEYELIIGLETHVELNTNTKIFCRCPVGFGAAPNVNCCPICTGMPGALPVLNREVVHAAALAGMALRCTVQPVSRMARKHYFYPDLSKGYQITQQDQPLCTDGYLELSDGRRVGIERIHIEEDAGKLVRQPEGILVDYNRGGVPLIEIVSRPDLRSARQAVEYLEFIQQTMRYLEISDCRMQEGSMRCDVNISVRPKGENRLGTRTEIKNMNSLSYLVKAVEYEYTRQLALLEQGKTVERETRRYDERTATTQPMRRKERETDYLYFEEPDLPPVLISQQELEQWKKELPELPREKRTRYIEKMKISPQEAEALTKYPQVARYFEQATDGLQYPARAAKMMVGPLFACFSDEREKQACKLPISAQDFGEVLRRMETGELTAPLGRVALERMLQTGLPLEKALPSQERDGITQEQLVCLCREAMQELPQAVQDFLNGREKALKALMGAVMRKSRGVADPVEVQRQLKSLLAASRFDGF